MALNPFAKAAILTIAVAALALVVVSQLDDARAGSLRKSVELVSFESESSRLVSEYAQLGDGDPCMFANFTTSLQKERAYSLAEKLGDYQRSNMVGADYEAIKRAYFVSLAELHIRTLENARKCPQYAEIPVLFFYREAPPDCPECRLQNEALVLAAQRCGNVRTFAFPVNANYSFIQLLVGKYKVQKVPAMVIDERELVDTIQNQDQIVAMLEKDGAACS